MPKNRIHYSEEDRAKEVFAVLINRQRPTRSYSRPEMKNELKEPEIYSDFLKLCCEHDDSENLKKFRHGLLFVLKAIGISKVAKETGISRITLYRMLSKEGNPELNSLVKVMGFLGMHLWVVDHHFMKANRRLVRMRAEKPDAEDVHVSYGRRVGPKRSSDRT